MYTHVVEEQRPEQLHYASVLHDLDVLRPRSGFRYRLDEGHPRLLVRLEVLQHRYAAHRAAAAVTLSLVSCTVLSVQQYLAVFSLQRLRTT